MTTFPLRVTAALLALLSTAAIAQRATVTPMTPDVVAKYDPVLPEADYVKRVVMVPMRDRTKLYTVIVMKKGAANAPILLPYYLFSSWCGVVMLGQALSGDAQLIRLIVHLGTAAF